MVSMVNYIGFGPGILSWALFNFFENSYIPLKRYTLTYYRLQCYEEIFKHSSIWKVSLA